MELIKLQYNAQCFGALSNAENPPLSLSENEKGQREKERTGYASCMIFIANRQCPKQTSVVINTTFISQFQTP